MAPARISLGNSSASSAPKPAVHPETSPTMARPNRNTPGDGARPVINEPSEYTRTVTESNVRLPTRSASIPDTMPPRPDVLSAIVSIKASVVCVKCSAQKRKHEQLDRKPPAHHRVGVHITLSRWLGSLV